MGTKNVRGRRTKPTKAQLDAARADGSVEKATLLLALAYVAMSEANNLVEEASDHLRGHGLELGTLATKHGFFTAAANRYFFEYVDMFKESGADPMGYFTDLEEFDKLVRKFGCIGERFKEIDGRAGQEPPTQAGESGDSYPVLTCT